MNLETVSAIAQLVAAIGVIASLFYLAVQIRQNTRSQRSVVIDSLTSSLITLFGQQSASPEQMRAFASVVEDWHGATEEDRRAMFAAGFRKYVEATQPVSGVSPLSQLIRGKS